MGPTINGAVYNTFLSTNNLNNLDGIFQAYQAYPGYWVQDEEGNAVYGSTTEQTKEVRNDISAKYEAYKKAGNPPLMDDENPQNEIVFPKD